MLELPPPNTFPVMSDAGFCHYFAAPPSGAYGGSPSNDGSLWSPWDLATALTKTAELNGKTLGLLVDTGAGDSSFGVYRGKFQSQLVNAEIRGVRSWGSVGSSGLDGAMPVIDGYVHTSLVNAMEAGTVGELITFEVADASELEISFNGGMTSLVVDGEVLYLGDVPGGEPFDGNNITARRGGSGSEPATAAAHAQGAVLRGAGHQFLVGGNNTTIRNLEITNSDPRRDWRIHGGEGVRGAGIAATSVSGTKIINNIIHDNLNGVFTGSASSNTEIYGNLIYNNGMIDGTDDGKGHGLYLENSAGFSKSYHNLILNNYGLGGQVYGRSANSTGSDLQGNVFANSGSPLGQVIQHRNLLVGPQAVRLPDGIVKDNILFHPANKIAYNMIFGYGAGADNGTIQNNYFIGGGGIGLELADVTAVTITGNKFSSTHNEAINIASTNSALRTINNNTYYATATSASKFNNRTLSANQTFAQWKSATSFDSASTIASTSLPQTVIIRPNAYEAGAANIIVIAATGTSVTIDLSQTGLPLNHYYVIKNANNINGNAVISGTYDSGHTTVTIPLTSAAALAVATPVGGSAIATTSPSFAVFRMYNGGMV